MKFTEFLTEGMNELSTIEKDILEKFLPPSKLKKHIETKTNMKVEEISVGKYVASYDVLFVNDEFLDLLIVLDEDKNKTMCEFVVEVFNGKRSKKFKSESKYGTTPTDKARQAKLAAKISQDALKFVDSKLSYLK